MKAEDAWGPRWANCAHPLSHEFMRIACEKESLVVLAADLPTVDGLVQLIEDVGESVCALKTHVDMVEGFNMGDWEGVVEVARSKGMLLFEDRKFADIGRVAQTQMGGLYDIRSWADLVTSHSVSGPDGSPRSSPVIPYSWYKQSLSLIRRAQSWGPTWAQRTLMLASSRVF